MILMRYYTVLYPLGRTTVLMRYATGKKLGLAMVLTRYRYTVSKNLLGRSAVLMRYVTGKNPLG
jgi:hypothetical protein